MTATDLRLELDNTAVDCGDVVSGSVVGAQASPDLHATLLVSATAVRGDHAAELQAIDQTPLAQGDKGARFELGAPRTGPITFDGQRIAVKWEVVITQSTWSPQAPRLAAATVTVLPDGGLAVWARQTAPPPH